MRISSWNETGLGLSEADIAAAWQPFARDVSAGDSDWARAVRTRRLRIARKYLLGRLLHWMPGRRRSETAVISEYDDVWRAGHARYRLGPPPHVSPWVWRDRPVWGHPLGATRFRQVMLAGIVERLRPREVLEVGCGDGINLMLLACRFPETRFTGIELTPEGHRAAVGLQETAQELPDAMQRFAPLPLNDPTAFRRVRFVRGSAAALPFADAAFDLVTTVLALEQMERIRDRALAGIARVTRGHAFMIEPFRDVNDRGWRRLNVIRRDYFRGRIDDLPRHGLWPEFAVDDYPQELFLRTCAVLARKHAATAGSSGTRPTGSACPPG